MPLGSALNSLLLASQNLNSNKPTVSKIKKVKDDKPVIFPRDEKINKLERVKPQEVGYSEEFVESYFKELRSDLSIRPNRIMLIKDNKVFGEYYEYPYVPDAWDCLFSTSKTITALALGVLYDQGKVDLDLPVCKILKNERSILVQKNKKITLRHLLTMSTGNTFNELTTAGTNFWIKDYFNSNLKFPLGTKFDYNSLNTYIISVCVEKLAGVKFEKFIREHVFNPLGIGSTLLDTSPEGYFKGGWGAYLIPEDMAKLGILVKDGGVYNGKRIISEEWINMMSHEQYPAKKFGHVYNYGFQMWADDEKNFCCFNGLYDQNIMIFRNTGVIVVTCCADSDAFHTSHIFKISEDYFMNKNSNVQLCDKLGSRELVNIDSLNYYFDYIANKDYKPVRRIANGCGILPLLLQNVLGTYGKGIKLVTFKKDENNNYSLIIKENQKDIEIKFTFKEGIRQVLEMYGNKFDVVCDARFILSGKGEPFLVIRLFFLEFSSSRYFTVKFGRDYDVLSFELTENPGFDFVNTMIETQDENTKSILGNLVNVINPIYINGAIRNIFAPSFPMVHGQEKINKAFGYKPRKKKKPVEKKK